MHSMPFSRAVNRVTIYVALVLGLGLVGCADRPTKSDNVAGSGYGIIEPRQDTASPLSKRIVDSWTEAGAEVGWMRLDDELNYLLFLTDDKEIPVDMPAFRISRWEKGLISTLPAPQSDFGLYLGGTQFNDSGLSELVMLENLASLNLVGTRITDEAVRDLASMKQLKSLCVFNTLITEAGLLEIQKALPDCRLAR